MDADFSPVSKVNFEVTNTRVGDETDLDEVTLEVYTKSLSPQAALKYALKEACDVFNQLNSEFDIKIDVPTKKVSKAKTVKKVSKTKTVVKKTKSINKIIFSFSFFHFHWHIRSAIFNRSVFQKGVFNMTEFSVKNLDAANLEMLLRRAPDRIQTEKATPDAIEACRRTGIELLLVPNGVSMPDGRAMLHA
jgi:hypothetical protein